MPNSRISILCTRPVDELLVHEAVAKGVDVDTISFIDTIAIQDEQVRAQVVSYASQPATIIFTSMNAVDAVAESLGHLQPDWQFFCLANTTRQLVEKYFGKEKIEGVADSAHELAEKIIAAEKTNAKNQPIVFFCGDQRREELPAALRKENIVVEECVTYQTIETPIAIEKDYDGLIFFSASAVNSFFRVNKAPQDAVFFALGTTTANTITDYCSNRIVKSSYPSKNDLFKQAIEWLQQPKQ